MACPEQLHRRRGGSVAKLIEACASEDLVGGVLGLADPGTELQRDGGVSK